MSTRRHRFGTRRREQGYILALSALLLIPLLAFTGFATDVGSWYARASRLQRVADAAALAGVVWQPNFDNAEDVALETAARNGLVDGQDGIQITVSDTGPRQLKVEIVDTQVEVYFTAMFFDEIEITRDATAEYLQSLPMGSPEPWLGNDPARSPAPNPYPNFWLNIGAPNMQKVQGDRYTNGSCEGSNAIVTYTAGCSGTANFGNNTDYEPDGYFYAIEVTQVGAGGLAVQLFDPAFTNRGSTCGSNQMAPSQMTALANLAETTMNNASTRYAQGAGTWCTGDSDAGSSIPGSPSSTNQGPQNTSFILRNPDDTPFDPTDNPVRPGCSRTFTGRTIIGSGSQAGTAADLDAGVSGTQPSGGSLGGTGIYNRLLPTTAHDQATVAEQGLEQIPFRNHFNQWWTLCNIADAKVGDVYYLQVRSNGQSASPQTLDPNNDRGGHNRYAIRAGWGQPAGSFGVQPTLSGVTVHAEGKLPIYVNATSAGSTTVTEFFLARIDERYQGAVLSLDFFDIGDTSGSVAFLVMPPDEATYGASGTTNLDTFTGCTITRDVPGRPLASEIQGCGVTGMNQTQYQGRQVNVQVPIPSTYQCNEGSNFGCWIKVRLTFSSGAQPTDQTTWTAAVLGDPVRLIE